MFLTVISICIPDYKLAQSNTIELRNKKKSQLKKVTGFQVNYSLYAVFTSYNIALMSRMHIDLFCIFLVCAV